MMKLDTMICGSAFAAAVLLISLNGALAHHSFAMFDQGQDATIEGTVHEFQWTAPHIWLDVWVMGEAGAEPVLWGIESQSPRILFNRGWAPDTIKEGDRVVVDLHPAKDGLPGGQMLRVTFADGRVITTSHGDDYFQLHPDLAR